jgi:NADH:ubiquinone reductase (H+-translocating)
MDSSRRAVVIVGGGFAGVYAARHLERRLPADRPIVLFSQENHLVFTPLLGNVVGSSINPMHVVWPIRQMVRRVACRTAAVTGLDLTAREVLYQTPGGRQARQPFDHLVLACGSVVNLNIVPGMAAHGWPLKTMGDALVLRNHVIGLLEKAQVEPDEDRRRLLLSVVVVGGGFSGVEVAGEIADLLTASRRYYRGIPPGEIQVTLLHSRDRLLPELPESLGEFTRRKMTERGIAVRLNARAAAVTEGGVRLHGGGEVAAATVVCTIGNTVNPLVKEAALPLDGGRVKAGPDLRVAGHENVWALGDCAAVPNAFDGQPSPPTAQFAVRQAKALAKNLAAAAAGKPAEPFRFKPLGAFASIGERRAVGQVFGMKFSGFPAWFMWRGVYLSKMPTLARKVQIAFDWLWQLFFPRDIVQLNLWQTERLNHAHYEAGQYVFHKGDAGDKFYLIEKGQAGVYLDESAAPFSVLGEGDHFGEGALLSGCPRTASIKAESPLDVLVLGHESFVQIMHHSAVIKAAMERMWAQRAESSSHHDLVVAGDGVGR